MTFGPSAQTENVEFSQLHLRDIPYAPFNKFAPIGRPADFDSDSKKRATLDLQQQQQAGSTSNFSYIHENDESFSVVDRITAPVPVVRVKGKGNPVSGVWGKASTVIAATAASTTRPSSISTTSSGVKAAGSLRSTPKTSPNPVSSLPSLSVSAEWDFIEEYTLAAFAKLAVEPVSGEDVCIYGSAQSYDRTFDRVSGKKPVQLKGGKLLNYNASASFDPVLNKVAESRKLPNGKQIQDHILLTSSQVLAALMTCPKSVSPWDIIIKKDTSKEGHVTIWFDKRDNSSIDLPTVSESSDTHPPAEDETNSPTALAFEAAEVERKFQQQILVKGSVKEFEKFPNSKEVLNYQALKYRQWKLREDVTIVVRTTIDALLPVNATSHLTLSVHALNEHFPIDPETKQVSTSHIDWKSKIDIQRGAIMANEMRNNKWKLARWTVEGMLADVDQMKFGLVSRQLSMNPARGHVLLGVQFYKPQEFGNQLNLDWTNAWGIVRGLTETIMKLEDGMFVLVKEASVQKVKLYRIPSGQKIPGFGEDGTEEE